MATIILRLYKPKKHQKMVVGQLLEGALSRIPKSLHSKNKLFRKDLARRLDTVSASDLVAGLTFGFWVTLIKQKVYADQYNTNRLWPDLIPVIFLHYARGDDERKNISKQFDEIKLIRTRLFHHEPIWKFKKANSPNVCEKE